MYSADSEKARLEHSKETELRRAYWRKWRIWLVVFLTWVLMMAMLKWPEKVSDAVQGALVQWYHSVAPALFPFMMLMPLITSQEAMLIYEKMLGGFMRLLFGLPGAAAPAVVIGMVAGSPAGVVAAGRVAENAGLDKRQLMRIAGCVCGLSPAFLISGIGAGLMQSIQVGKMLFVTQLMAQLFMMATTRWMRSDKKIFADTAESDEAGVKTAVSAVLTVAGYMAFFSVVACIISELLGQKIGSGLICILEISAGVCKIAGFRMTQEIKMVLLAAMCGFGGICICAQNMKFLKKYGISAVGYISLRLLNGVVNAGIMAALQRFETEISWQLPPNYISFLTLIAIFLVIPALIELKKSIS